MSIPPGARYLIIGAGGLGVFTPDNSPVSDVIYDNGLVIADSNHGYIRSE